MASFFIGFFLTTNCVQWLFMAVCFIIFSAYFLEFLFQQCNISEQNSRKKASENPFKKNILKPLHSFKNTLFFFERILIFSFYSSSIFKNGTPNTSVFFTALSPKFSFKLWQYVLKTKAFVEILRGL